MSVIYPEIKQFIGGEWIAGTGDTFCVVFNPASGKVIAKYAAAGKADLDRALAASTEGLALWRKYAPAARTDILLRAALLLRERAEEIAPLVTLEQGQTIADARAFITRGAEIIEWDANEGRRLYGRIIPTQPGLRQMVVREPVGVVAAFTPWNAPIFTPCRKIGSTLAAGCSVIIKAAEETPASTMALVRVFQDAGVPPGVINLVYGNPALISEYLIAAPEVRLITFTGSVPIGKHLAQLASARMKPSIMELGGHAPVIVCEDADVALAAQRSCAAKFRNAAQACVAPSRFFIHESVFGQFVEAFIKEVRKVKMGNGLEAGVTMGPLANVRRLGVLQALVDDALTRGANMAYRGPTIESEGYYFAPAVLTNVPADARLLLEEPFGPVVSLAPYGDLDKVIAEANALPFGLAGYIFTRSAAQADKIASALECGTIGINHFTVSTHGVPFGGVKDSGYGREGGLEGVAGYTIEKSISHLMD
jgi:succinate-semialdehyde dehydrogenase/glutarate-semialdehyde dehydrogenase